MNDEENAILGDVKNDTLGDVEAMDNLAAQLIMKDMKKKTKEMARSLTNNEQST